MVLTEGRRAFQEIARRFAQERLAPGYMAREREAVLDRGLVHAQRTGTSVHYSLRSPKIVQAVDLLREFLAEDLAERGALGNAATG